MEIKEEIQKLIDVQKLDSQLLVFRGEAENEKPALIREFRETIQSNKSSLSSLEEELKRIQVSKKEKELDLQTKEDALRKYHGQLYQLKTNQEYKAKLKEIGSHKADISIIEEEIIRMLERIDDKAKELNEHKNRMQEQEKQLNDKIRIIEDQIKELQIKITNLQDKRGILVDGINSGLLAKYEHLLEHRQGRALVPLQNSSCGGCFMNLPAEITNRIKYYKEIIIC